MLGLLAVNVAFIARGEAATYTPDGGTAIGCTVIVDRAAEPSLDDQRADGGVASLDGLPRGSFVAIDVRKSEVAAPARKGLFAVTGTGESFRVQARPRAQDSQGFVWTMWAVTV